MHAVVCIKQVPDSLDLRINPETGTLVRAGVVSVINSFDVHAIEEALRLKDRHGGKVTVITMGPPQAAEALRTSVSLGADEAILITDKAFAAADTLATSKVLATAIQKIAAQEPVDLVFCGKQTSDSDTAQTGPGIATRLGFTQFTYVMGIDWVDFGKGEIQVRRLLEDAVEVMWGRLPALITVVKEINEPRYATFPGLLRAATFPITVWNRESLGLAPEEVGVRGSPTVVARAWAPPPKSRGDSLADVDVDPEEAARRLLAKLVERNLVKAG